MTAFADLSLHVVGEEGLLLDSSHRKLYALNASAAFIWSLLKDGQSPAEASRSLSARFAVPADEAVAYVADVLRQYDQPSDLPPDAPITNTRRRLDRSNAGVIETYALLGSIFRVRYDNPRLAEQIHPLLQHDGLRNGGLKNGGLKNGGERANVVDIAVVPDGDGIVIVADEKEIGSSRTLEDAAVAARACLTQLAVTASGGLCVLHAGALCRNGVALLLPGEAGHGKSTLSAGLAARGFDMLCDDTTLLAGEPPLVRSLPTGLCIKRGAYSVLEPDYPHLLSLPEWRRPDGRQARYLMPGRDLPWAAPDVAVAVHRIVFPHYHPDHSTTLLPLRRHEALGRLLRGVCFLSGTLDKQNLDKLIAWIEQIDCFELPLSSLDAATPLIDDLCP